MKKRNKIIFALLLCAVLVAGGALFLRLRNGIFVKPSGDYAPPAQTVLYRQDDPAWAADSLGDSKYTMKSSGCLVSCIAAALSMEGDAVTPGELNALFSESGVYDNNGNMQWDALEAIEGFSARVYDAPSAAAIAECLAEGYHPIVRVRLAYGLGNIHYVLITGTEGGAYICMDPLANRCTKLSQYGNRIYAVRCVSKEA